MLAGSFPDGFEQGIKLMKSLSMARLWGCAVALVVSCAVLPLASRAPVVARELSARAKPAERCVPKHPYAAADQPECWRYLP
jgi:hypothetical protein